MNKIHFDHLNFRDNKAQFILLILAFILIILNFLEFWTFENPKIGKLINIAIFLFLAFIHSKIFWYKNFVQWNKKGIMIKLNEFWGKNFQFEEISNYNIQNNELIISKYDGQKKVFNLQNIESESINRLANILKANT